MSAYLWVGNGTAQEQVFSDYDNGAPESIPNGPDQLEAVFRALLEDDLRLPVAAVASASEIFGKQENQLGSTRPTAW